jgi:hypothetical protein
MTSPSIAIPRPTRLPRILAVLAAAAVVALIAAVSLMLSSAGQGTTHIPAFGQSGSVSSDCLSHIPSHPC